MKDLPIQTLMYRLRGQYPSLGISLDAPDSPIGQWFLDLPGPPRITIQWHHSQGFGLSVDGDGYGEKPDELYTTTEAIFGRVLSLLDPAIASHPSSAQLESMTLAELRKKIAGINQTDLSARMGIKQSTVSNMERGSDPQMGSVQQYVQALGGELQITAIINGQSIPLRFGRTQSHA